MKLDKKIRERLQKILLWDYKDEEYNELDMLDIVEELVEKIDELEEQIIDIEEDMAENYKYIGGEL